MPYTQLETVMKHLDVLAYKVCPTLDQIRFFNVSLAKTYQREEFSEAKYYPIDVDMYASLANISKGAAMTECISLCKFLSESTFTVDMYDGCTLYTRIFVDYKFDESANTLSVQWNPRWIKKVSGEQEPGTYITVDTRMSAVPSKKRYMLYECLQQHLWRLNKQGFFVLTVELLRASTNTKPGEYKEFREFKRNVIDPTLKDMKDILDFKLKYEVIRASRKVVKIHFYLDDEYSLTAMRDKSAASLRRNKQKRATVQAEQNLQKKLTQASVPEP